MTIHWLSVMTTATDIAQGLAVYLIASVPATALALCLLRGGR